ncbi:MAG TPA: DNA-directed RNA polymerase subunit alpha [Candidatus Paceibacterota bacterium]
MIDTQILLPSKYHVIKTSAHEGVFSVEGLYPGYGHTLGNSLRRIILSSMKGTAVTRIKITDAPHEFTTIEGIKEDVMSIILNLKKARFGFVGDEPQTLTLSIKGAQTVTAGSFTKNGSVEILTPDQYICELTTKTAKLDLEITLEKGIGFVTSDLMSKEKIPVGTMVLDAVFSPVKKVSYEVDDMRVGNRVDYNRLSITIQTDGSVTPEEVFKESVHIMINQLRAVLELSLEEMPQKKESSDILASIGTSAEPASAFSQDEMNDLLKTRIESLSLSARTQNILSDSNIRTLGGLVRKSEADLLELPGFGQKALDEIIEALAQKNLKLRD